MQSIRPRILNLPLQLGLCVQFSSRFLINTLPELGICSSYSEIQRYDVLLFLLALIFQALGCAFPQHMADNVDNNLRNLDGYNTFHGMWLIAVTTPETDIAKIIPRVKVTAEDITAVGKINIAF